MFRNIQSHAAHSKIRVSTNLIIRQNHMPKMLAVGGRKKSPERIHGQTILPAPSNRIKAVGNIRPEANPPAPQFNRSHLGVFLAGNSSPIASSHCMNLIIKAPSKAVQHLLNIVGMKASEKNFRRICLTIVVSIL